MIQPATSRAVSLDLLIGRSQRVTPEMEWLPDEFYCLLLCQRRGRICRYHKLRVSVLGGYEDESAILLVSQCRGVRLHCSVSSVQRVSQLELLITNVNTIPR